VSVDTRNSYDGLAGVLTTALGRDPESGDLFVFENRRGDRLKILAWQGNGFAIDMRRLERGTFAFPEAGTPDVTVTPTQLAMILGGVELAGTRRRPRYTRPDPPGNLADTHNPFAPSASRGRDPGPPELALRELPPFARVNPADKLLPLIPTPRGRARP
jgi:transposase